MPGPHHDRSPAAHDAVEQAAPDLVEPAPAAGLTLTQPVAGLAHAVRRRGAVGPTTDPLGGTAVDRDVADALRRRQGQGVPLPGQLADALGQQYGADLSGVRVHADQEAATISRSLQAQAFTHGTDVYFAQGTYAPQSADGQRLIAHEAAHVVQQRNGRASNPGSAPTVGHADDPVEVEADRMADTALSAIRRQASASEGSATDEASRPADPSGATGSRLRRKVGFEAELTVPSLGAPKGTLKYPKLPDMVTDNIKSFLDGGVPYDTDIGGKGQDVRLDSDHTSKIDRGPLVDALRDRGYVTGTPFEPETKLEFVTTAVDELAPGADKRLNTVITSLTGLMGATLTEAKSGRMRQIPKPANDGFKTGIPVRVLKEWWSGTADQGPLDALVDDFLANRIKDDVYLQATVGIIPSALMKFFARSELPGGKVRVKPPGEGRAKILGIVQEVVADLDKTFSSLPKEHWVQELRQPSKDAFLGLLGLAFSYLLANTLHQTTAGTNSVEKNAVPFLIKMSPYGLLAKTGPQALKDKPPSKEFVRSIGDDFKKSKYLQVAYWVEEAGKDPTAMSEGRITKKIDARAPDDTLFDGDYTDFIERVLLGSSIGDVAITTGKTLPGPDKPPTDSGGLNVFWELYNQSAIPLEYRAITKRYKVSEVAPALEEIIDDVRRANMSGLSDEQQELVKKAYKG
jgi:hypothetical protein